MNLENLAIRALMMQNDFRLGANLENLRDASSEFWEGALIIALCFLIPRLAYLLIENSRRNKVYVS